jgi:hypothetical protein
MDGRIDVRSVRIIASAMVRCARVGGGPRTYKSDEEVSGVEGGQAQRHSAALGRPTANRSPHLTTPGR